MVGMISADAGWNMIIEALLTILLFGVYLLLLWFVSEHGGGQHRGRPHR